MVYEGSTSLLAIYIVDAWKLYIVSKGDAEKMIPTHYHSELADGLIDNCVDKIALRL